MKYVLRWLSLLPVMLTTLLGCSGGPKIYHVSGTVMYDNKPLPAGVIYFNPDVTKSNDGPQGYAIIKNGEYNTAVQGGSGTVGGPHIARIEGFDGTPAAELPMGKLLFANYQHPVDLPREKATQNFDIPVQK